MCLIKACDAIWDQWHRQIIGLLDKWSYRRLCLLQHFIACLIISEAIWGFISICGFIVWFLILPHSDFLELFHSVYRTYCLPLQINYFMRLMKYSLYWSNYKKRNRQKESLQVLLTSAEAWFSLCLIYDLLVFFSFLIDCSASVLNSHGNTGGSKENITTSVGEIWKGIQIGNSYSNSHVVIC